MLLRTPISLRQATDAYAYTCRGDAASSTCRNLATAVHSPGTPSTVSCRPHGPGMNYLGKLCSCHSTDIPADIAKVRQYMRFQSSQ